MKYADLYNTGMTFAKISKSSIEIASKCIKPFYIDYNHFLVKDNDQCGHGVLSFVTLDRVVLCLLYGDTFTELETGRLPSKIFCSNVDVKALNNAFQEYVSPQIVVKRNAPLNDIEIQKYIVMNADSICLAKAAFPPFPSMCLSKHFDSLKMSDASMFWREIEDKFAKISKEYTEYGKIGNMIKRELMNELKALNKQTVFNEKSR